MAYVLMKPQVYLSILFQLQWLIRIIHRMSNGMLISVVLTKAVVYTERGANIRIISCRKATPLEMRSYEGGNE